MSFALSLNAFQAHNARSDNHGPLSFAHVVVFPYVLCPLCARTPRKTALAFKFVNSQGYAYSGQQQMQLCAAHPNTLDNTYGKKPGYFICNCEQLGVTPEHVHVEHVHDDTQRICIWTCKHVHVHVH